MLVRICREINVFFQVRISHALRFISMCNLFTDSPSYMARYSYEVHRYLLSSTFTIPVNRPVYNAP
jgi:hypothetical protein